MRASAAAIAIAQKRMTPVSEYPDSAMPPAAVCSAITKTGPSASSTRTVSGLALLIGPALPFTSLGIADHLSERRAERSAPEG